MCVFVGSFNARLSADCFKQCVYACISYINGSQPPLPYFQITAVAVVVVASTVVAVCCSICVSVATNFCAYCVVFFQAHYKFSDGSEAVCGFFNRINSVAGVNPTTFVLSHLTVEQLTKNRKQNV